MSTSGTPAPPSDRPAGMYRRDRPTDEIFEANEMLYYRIDVPGNVGDHPDGVDIRLPEDSVNRSKYSEPTDVLYPNHFALGIAQFLVGSIPVPRSFLDQQGTRRYYSLKVEHNPEEANYAHSEVRAFRDGERVQKSSKIPVIIKSEFRQAIAEAMVIYKATQK